MTATPTDPERNRAACIVALFSVLVDAWRRNDFPTAAQAHDELVQMGVLVRFDSRHKTRRKEADHE